MLTAAADVGEVASSEVLHVDSAYFRDKSLSGPTPCAPSRCVIFSFLNIVNELAEYFGYQYACDYILFIGQAGVTWHFLSS